MARQRRAPATSFVTVASWDRACFLGSVRPATPGATRLTVDVLLIDSAGDAVRLRASGWTVDEAVACAEAEAGRRLGGDHCYSDWRAA